jgi:addiction module HigA family antidote
MSAKKLHPIHPGEVLREEFIKPMGISQREFAQKIGVPHTRLNQIVRENRSVTADTTLRLSRALETTRSFGSTCKHVMTWTKSETNPDKKLSVKSIR